mgnify:CR=1 FL=1
MKKILAILVLGAFAASVSTSAMACGFHKVAGTKSGPITTALDSQPITPVPQPKSGG